MTGRQFIIVLIACYTIPVQACIKKKERKKHLYRPKKFMKEKEKKIVKDADKLSVPFTVEHMMLLLKIYDAFCGLEEAMGMILGGEQAFLYEENIIGQLSYLGKLIQDISPLGKVQMQEGQDYYDMPLSKYLETPDMDLRERAEKILFGVE